MAFDWRGLLWRLITVFLLHAYTRGGKTDKAGRNRSIEGNAKRILRGKWSGKKQTGTRHQEEIMMQEKKICAVVREEYWITEDEQQFILAYRKADKDIQNAVNRLLDVEEEDDI